MSSGERWRVALHNDDHNTFAVVHYLLRKICGLDWDAARDLTMKVHETDGAYIGAYDRETAESLTVELLRHGLSASVRRAA